MPVIPYISLSVSSSLTTYISLHSYTSIYEIYAHNVKAPNIPAYLSQKAVHNELRIKPIIYAPLLEVRLSRLFVACEHIILIVIIIIIIVAYCFVRTSIDIQLFIYLTECVCVCVA